MKDEILMRHHFYSRNAHIDSDTEQRMIAERAYCKAQKRNFSPGHELEDWLEAEREIRNQRFYWLLG